MSHFLFRHKKLSLLLLSATSVCLIAAFPFFKSTQLQTWFSSESQQISKEKVAATLSELVNSPKLPEQLDFGTGPDVVHAHVKYTVDSDAQEYIEHEILRWRPDYAAFVAIDARTGRILAMSTYQHEGVSLGNLALRPTFPAASVFKVVTAAAAIDQKKITADSRLPFTGAYHTLYKHNVMSTQVTRWTREMSIREAFAKSVNSIFGKIGVFHVGSQGLREYANRFMFNQKIRADFPAQMGVAAIPEGSDDWLLAEAASGFTPETTMSPIQGALIAAAVANDGVMMEPTLIDSIQNDQGEAIYQSQPSIASVTMNSASAADVRLLMQETVSRGTSHKSFRKVWRRKDYTADLELGGKTGSLHGNDPVGRYDWFVGYLRYKDQKIAVSALTINEQKWRVKSAYLAGEFLAELMKQQQRRSPSSVRIFSAREISRR
jgi:cell division protein FtsI/penicillin-binding protein 2